MLLSLLSLYCVETGLITFNGSNLVVVFVECGAQKVAVSRFEMREMAERSMKYRINQARFKPY